ncbi:MAG: hypothetical protein ACOY94_02695 [Bacillota bacterium]
MHEMALESRGRLTANVVDLTHHPEWMERFSVTTVPYFVVGEKAGFPGPLPELILLQRIHDHAASS